MDSISMSIEDALVLIRKSIEFEKYDNARAILEDIIKSHTIFKTTIK